MPFTSKADLENRMGADRLRQFTDDDNDGVADDDAISEVVDDTDAEIRSVLIGKGYSEDQLTKMEGDKALRRIAARIGAEYAGDRRAEFKNPDGTNAYSEQAERARRELDKYARGEKRSAAEPQAGKSANLKSLRTAGEPRYVVRANPRDPDDNGPGGF